MDHHGDPSTQVTNQAAVPASDQGRGDHTLSEIRRQPQGWSEAYTQLVARQAEVLAAWGKAQPQQILVTGCGSTYYLAQITAALFQALTGIPARGVPASEIALFPEQVLYQPASTLLIAISRSGTTTETAAAMDQFRARGGKTIWGITCYADTPVGQESDFVMLTDMAQEQSIAQTLSFSTMLFTAQGLAAQIGGHDLAPLGRVPAACQTLLDQFYPQATQWGTAQGIERFFFLGSGYRYGIACEAMLKMKEMSITHAEAYHFLEFRHGPKALVDEHAMVVGLLGRETFVHEAAVLREMGEMGGKTVAFVPGTGDGGKVGEHTVELPGDLPAWTLPALYLPILQSMGHARSMHKGLDPDNPRNLSAVVFLERASLR
jgi:glutamine---fructose-6-phosphate transaminase (isomerizing)